VRNRASNESLGSDVGFSLCDVLSVTEDSVTLLWRTERPGDIEVRCGPCVLQRKSLGRVQWARLEALAPDRDHELTVRCCGGPPRRLRFRTLPRPGDRPLLTFAVVADPHVSFGKECAHGRLFDESRRLLEETVDDVNREGADLVILPGDISEDGLEAEMREARRILDGLACRVMPVFGDHELVGNTAGRELDQKAQRALWREVFGRDCTWYAQAERDFLFIALDTDDGHVCEEQLAWLDHTLKTAERRAVFVAAHRAVLPNPFILDNDFAVDNWREVAEILRRSSRVAGVFCGHKNVPAFVRSGGLSQLSCPQISEFLCGWQMVKVYRDRWVHSFRPIRSETLMEQSYRRCLENGQPQWNPLYRVGQPEGRNGVTPLPPTLTREKGGA